MQEGSSLERIEDANFPVSLLGYKRNDVDAFLRLIAAEHRQLQKDFRSAKRSADNAYQSLGERMGSLLQHASNSADQLHRDAKEEASRLRQEARKAAKSIKERAEKQAADALAAAEYEAAKRIEEAKQSVERLLKEEEEVRQRLTSVRTELRSMGERLERAETSLPTRGSSQLPADSAAGPAAADPAQGAKPELRIAGEEEPIRLDEEEPIRLDPPRDQVRG
jgi:cell division initiation protein